MRRRLLLAATIAAAFPAQSAPLRDVWRDRQRGRAVPVLIRLPSEPGPRPVVLLSHGLGGTREGLAYLGNAFAGSGWIAVHLQHAGSDAEIWRDAWDKEAAIAAAGSDGAAAVARLRDATFALDEVLRRAALPSGPLAGRVDPEAIAIAGHSSGAWTVQHVLGQSMGGGEAALGLPDERFCAGIALSPIPPRDRRARGTFARVATPMLHVTGTRDSGVLENATATDREIPFRMIEGAPQVLAVFDGATHTAFADEPPGGPRWAPPTWHPRVSALSVLFLRAMLEDDAGAVAALRDGARGLVGQADRVEVKGV
ncbi:alpha/beta hydrolase family protein [Falsiroseomonas sp. HW251]|uniref:alpha/beta hydrolase family protein n=1 Tax=Falsiroseomonas sp. HW251 TaxID=3390998 RepID=UPI003D323D88